MFYKCLNTGKKTNIKDLKNASRALKLHCTKLGYDWLEEAMRCGYEPATCGFCGNMNRRIESLKYEVIDRTIRITGANPPSPPFYCMEKTCSCKENPNSVAFVTVAYGLSAEEAIEKIHSRNSSPFYQSNHASVEEYAESQKKMSVSNPESKRRKIKYANSLEAYVDRFGEEEGRVRFGELCKSKAITLEKMISKYGDEEGPRRYERWKSLVVQSLENTIRVHGIDKGEELFSERFKARIEKLSKTNSDRFKLGNGFGHVSFTDSGTRLNSSTEKYVYERLTEYGLIENVDYKINGKYPGNSIFEYDFFFIKSGRYLEIAGMSGYSDHYDFKIRMKEVKFGATILKPRSAGFKKLLDEFIQKEIDDQDRNQGQEMHQTG